MDSNVKVDELTEVLSAPLGDLIASVGRGVAQAQESMNAQALDGFRALQQGDSERLRDLQTLGYQPTWYRIPEVEAEMVMSLSISGKSSRRASGEATLYATPVDANFVNKFGYDLQASSKLNFRIVPVPPPPNSQEVRFVPSLEGKTFRQAQELLGAAELTWVAELDDGSPATEALESDLVRTVEPAAGAMVTVEQTVLLILKQV